MPFFKEPDRIRLLAVDDDPIDLEALRRHLADLEKFEIEFHGVATPSEVMALIKAGEVFDVAILDYMLGIESGVDLLRSIRQVDAELPVIMLTGRTDNEMMSDVVRAGVSDYLPKDRMSAASLERSIGNAVAKGVLRREICKQQADLRLLVDKLKRREEENSSFYHVISHELKTPLTAIREFVSITLDGLAGDLNDEQREFLGVAVRNCDHLAVLLGDLFDVTRSETGKLTIDTKPMQVAELFDRVSAEFHSTLEASDLVLRVNCAKDLPPVMGDEGRLIQVVSNLMSNAIKFTPKGGVITLAANFSDSNREEIHVSVKDTGCGMEPDQCQRVFDRLYQVRREDFSIAGGLGLGLYLCEGLVRSHGGRIWAESEPSQGSCFTFALPIAPQSLALQSTHSHEKDSPR